MLGTLTQIQRFSLHDGPGIRTTVFFKGCPLRCFWCHNPETWSEKPTLIYEETKCLHCEDCMQSCKTGALSLGAEGDLRHEGQLCTSCFSCSGVCAGKALRVCGRTWSSDALLEELLQDRSLYERSGGGVTFSGGEPTAQPDFLAELLEACRDKALSTALDTCGYCETQTFERLARKADLVLLDFKHPDSQKHRALTGVQNELVLENARRLDQLGIETEIRIPVIPGNNDDQETMIAFAGFIKPLNCVSRITLLGYHKLGLSKYTLFDHKQRDPGLRSPTKAEMQQLCDFMQALLPNQVVSHR